MNMAITMAGPTRRRPKAEMSKRSRGRTPKNWAYRVSIAATVGLAGFAIVTQAVAYQLRSSNSDLAHHLAPYDGRLTAMAAAFLAGPEASVENRRQANSIAKLALRQDATAVAAASTLGLNAQILNAKSAAGRYFGFAENLSRRDMQTQLWAIEDAVGRGDISNALVHYDAALRTTPSLSQMLFPVLASASTDPQIAGPLVRTLKARPAWGESFISYIPANTPDPRSTKQFLVELAKTGVKVPASTQSGIINALLTSGFNEEAWNYYALVNPNSSRTASRDPRFARNVEDASPFDWTPTGITGVSTSIQRAERHGVFDFAAPAMLGGTLLQQLQLLPPGSYKLAGHSIGIEQVANARPYWQLACRGGRELGRVTMTNSNENNGNFAGMLQVPSDCPVQVLSLIAQPSEAVSGLSGQIDFVQLSPATK